MNKNYLKHNNKISLILNLPIIFLTLVKVKFKAFFKTHNKKDSK